MTRVSDHSVYLVRVLVYGLMLFTIQKQGRFKFRGAFSLRFSVLLRLILKIEGYDLFHHHAEFGGARTLHAPRGEKIRFYIFCLSRFSTTRFVNSTSS